MTTRQIDPDAVEFYLRGLQATICDKFETLDQSQPQIDVGEVSGDGKFRQDEWEFSSGGGGDSRILEDGYLFEKAGVNFSCITGDKLPAAATEKRSELKGRSFTAMGISLVAHPRNPHVPTTHMNLRFIYVDSDIWWFGGGFDLTPYYGYFIDAEHWHKTAYKACKPFGDSLYDRLKKWCDQYFFIKHRNETRGIGGLFFDDFTEGGFDNSFSFICSVGDHFLEAYCPIVERRANHVYGEHEREFQLMRRGRYVEFNLIYDRGTLFGLQSGGRTESILMSLPPHVSWRYDWKPKPESREQELIENFLKPRDWISHDPE